VPISIGKFAIVELAIGEFEEFRSFRWVFNQSFVQCFACFGYIRLVFLGEEDEPPVEGGFM